MKKLLVAVNGLLLLAGVLVVSSFFSHPASASAWDMQNRSYNMMRGNESMKTTQRHRRHRRHRRHHRRHHRMNKTMHNSNTM